MDDFTAYAVIGILSFGIGLIAGYLVMTRYYEGRFVSVAIECEKAETIVPIISEMERES